MIAQPIFDIARLMEAALHQDLDPVLGGGASERRQESAPFAGSPLFVTEMLITVPPGVSLAKVRADLETAGNELNCDVDLDPAEA